MSLALTEMQQSIGEALIYFAQPLATGLPQHPARSMEVATDTDLPIWLSQAWRAPAFVSRFVAGIARRGSSEEELPAVCAIAFSGSASSLAQAGSYK